MPMALVKREVNSTGANIFEKRCAQRAGTAVGFAAADPYGVIAG